MYFLGLFRYSVNSVNAFFASPAPTTSLNLSLGLLISATTPDESSAVTARLDPELLSRLFLAVRLEVPREIRLQRVRNRSLAQFGSRMLPGGDLYEQEQAKQNAALASERRSQIGSGDRSERIRTYNFPQNRVTDHRLSGDMKNFNLQNIINGELDGLIDCLVTSDQTAKLQAQAEE